MHFVEYGVLGFLVAHAAFRTWPQRHPVRIGLLAVWITTLWGLLDEIHQALVPGRSAEMLDLVADAAGAIAGSSLCAVGFVLASMRRPAESR